MNTAKMVACYVILGLLAGYGLYGGLTADTISEMKGGFGIALLVLPLLCAAALFQHQRRKLASKPAFSEIQDDLIFTRFPAPTWVVPAILALMALSFLLLGQSGIFVRQPWLASAGMWGCGGLALLLLILPWKVVLRLSPRGLDHTMFRVGTIPWSEIRDVKRKTDGGYDVVVLDLRTPEKFRSTPILRRLFKGLDRRARAAGFVIMPFLIGGEADHIAWEISRRINAFGSLPTAEHASSVQIPSSEVL